jgi:polysaccharide biosynthesis transport protein
MEPSDALVRSLRRRWPLLILAALIAAAGAYLFASQQPDEYRVTTRLLVGPPTDAPVDTLRSAGLMAHTYGDLARSRSSLLAARAEAGVEDDVEELATRVNVHANETTRMLTIAVVDEDPDTAAAVARSISDRIVDAAPAAIPVVDPSQPDGIPRLPAGILTVVDATDLPVEPLEQPVVLITLLAAMVGAALAGTAAVALELAPWRRPPANLEALRHRRLLGRLSIVPSGGAAPLTKRRLRDRAGRERQLIATKLQHLTAGRPSHSLAVFGGSGRDGSTTVAAGLATSFADDGRSVILVDLTRDPELVKRFRLGKRKREVVTVGSSVLELAEIDETRGTLRVLLSDTARGDDATAVPDHVTDLLQEIADLVVIVAPPVLLEYGTVLVAGRTDGSVIVATDDADSIDGAIEAFDLLEAHGATVLGTVLAATRASVHDPVLRASEPPASLPAQSTPTARPHSR